MWCSTIGARQIFGFEAEYRWLLLYCPSKLTVLLTGVGRRYFGSEDADGGIAETYPSSPVNGMETKLEMVGALPLRSMCGLVSVGAETSGRGEDQVFGEIE